MRLDKNPGAANYGCMTEEDEGLFVDEPFEVLFGYCASTRSSYLLNEPSKEHYFNLAVILESIYYRTQNPHLYSAGQAELGICNAIEDTYWHMQNVHSGTDYSNLFSVIAWKWPQHTGWAWYPVPNTDTESVWNEFNFCNVGNYFNAETEYGALRLDLLDFVTRYCKERA